MKLTKQDIDDLNSLVHTGYIRRAEHPTLPLSIYNYTPKTQFSNAWNRITRTTRGLVLNKDYEIVIKCPEKFFSKGEPLAAEINLLNARISEKLDGYYISIKNDVKYGPIITSRGSFNNRYTEATKALLEHEYVPSLRKNYTYFCELCQNFAGDEAIILTKHPEPKLVCWAIQDENFHELIPDKTCPFPVAKELSLAEAKKYLEQKVEGVVAQDLGTFERLKIKTEWFVEHHRILSDCTKKRAWEILSSYEKIEDLNIPDEFMKQMKQYEKELGQEFSTVLQNVQTAHDKTASLTDKELGLLEDYQDIKPLLFLLRKDRTIELYDKIWQKIKPHNVV